MREIIDLCARLCCESEVVGDGEGSGYGYKENGEVVCHGAVEEQTKRDE